MLPFGLSAPWLGKRPLVNVRVEGLDRRPTARRCLVATDGWYEWGQRNGERLAWYHTLGHPFFLAGVVEGDRFAVLTVDAAPGLRSIHERMPVVLEPGRERSWLEQGDPAALVAREIAHHRVGKAVGNVRAEGPALIEAI